MIYLDSSALLKLVFEEAESNDLADWLGRDTHHLVTCELSRIEVSRSVQRIDPAALGAACQLLGGCDLIPMTTVLVDQACEIGSPSLRSLDAIHLAAAMSIREVLVAFVTYDHRLLDAATATGLPITTPGRT